MPTPSTGNEEHLLPHSEHWADVYARRIVRERPKENPEEPFVCASGITPSGTIHIGNFREIISVDLVVRALRDMGFPVRFVYSWDDYDVFRKVPANMPQQEQLKQFLRQPITQVPDVCGDADSYAQANEKELERVLPKVGIKPEYIYQAAKYQSSTYAENICKALEHREVIREQLNEHRTEPLPKDWWPISFFCGNCHRDETFCVDWDGKWLVQYRCDYCKHSEQIDLRYTGLAKLPWRIDWPMRWAYEKVDFEPAGKDHHSEGGSFSTAKKTSLTIYGYKAPITFQYDFVRIKGLGGKISSSSGEVLSLADVLEIYVPEVVRFLFASTRPNSEFAISFDLDVLKIYDDFIRCENIFYQRPEEPISPKQAKKQAKLKRIYELSQVESPAPEQPFSMPLRHLCNLLQVYNGNIREVRQFLAQEGVSVPEHSQARFQNWAECAWNWVQKYAPEEFCFRLRKLGEPLGADCILSTEFLNFLPNFRQYLQLHFCTAKFDRQRFSSDFYSLMKNENLESQQVFPFIYQLLICRNDGPRLLGFLEAVHSAIGLEVLLKLLETS